MFKHTLELHSKILTPHHGESRDQSKSLSLTTVSKVNLSTYIAHADEKGK